MSSFKTLTEFIFNEINSRLLRKYSIELFLAQSTVKLTGFGV